MKKNFFLLLLFPIMVFGQVGIGTQTPDNSAILDINSNSKGILIPRLSTSERDAIVSPANGLIVFNSTTQQLNFFNGTSWVTYVDDKNSQTIEGVKTFSNDIIPNGRMMLPMGELSYFKYATGFNVNFPSYCTGAPGNDNMVKVSVTSDVNFVNDNFGTGNNTRLTYNGTTGRYFHIALSFSFSPGTNNSTYLFGVAKNGLVQDSSKIINKGGTTADSQSSAMHVLLWLLPGDYIEFYAGSFASNSLVIRSFNFVAIGM